MNKSQWIKMIEEQKNNGEFEEKVNNYIETIEDEKVITFIDEGHNMVKQVELKVQFV